MKKIPINRFTIPDFMSKIFGEYNPAPTQGFPGEPDPLPGEPEPLPGNDEPIPVIEEPFPEAIDPLPEQFPLRADKKLDAVDINP